MKVLKNFKSKECFDYLFSNGVMRFTADKIMIKPKYKLKFKTIMNKINGRWGCNIRKKDVVDGTIPFYFYAIEGLRLKGITLILYEFNRSVHVVTCSRLFKHETLGQELNTMIYYDPKGIKNENS